ncbi:MAG: YolD-like family protein [Halobacillus sp.]
MLPEHVEEIQKLRREDEQVEIADLDEQKLEEIEFALQRLRATTYQ